MSDECAGILLFIIGGICGIYTFNHNFEIKWKHNNIEQVGHMQATAHIQCYENGKTIYNGFVHDLEQDKYGYYKFIEEHTGKKITISGTCLIEE